MQLLSKFFKHEHPKVAAADDIFRIMHTQRFVLNNEIITFTSYTV